MATRENVCCQLPGVLLAFPLAMNPERKDRKPWPMKWVVLAIVLFIPIYTYLTLHYRRPGPMFNPYEDMREQAEVLRLLHAGFHRVAIEASRPAEAIAESGAPTLPAPGGLPRELSKDLIGTPLMALEVVSVSAEPTAVSGIDYPIAISFTLPDNKRQLSGAHMYERAGEIVIVADFERLDGILLARTRDGTALLTVPPGSLRPGTYRVTVVGERASRSWTLRVK